MLTKTLQIDQLKTINLLELNRLLRKLQTKTSELETLFKAATAGGKEEPPVPPIVDFGDSPNLDAFDRLRVSEPLTVFDAQFQYDASPLLWETTATVASATHNANASTVTLALTSTDTAQSVLRQSYEYVHHQPGKSQLLLMTFNFVDATIPAEVTKEVGYGDDANGLFLVQTGNGIVLRLRSSVSGAPVDTDVLQGLWNIDNMDGSGPSGILLDWSKVQLLAIDFEWLGGGRVRYCFIIDGMIYPVHEVLNANATSSTYMGTPNLPVRYKLSKTSGTSTATLLQISASVLTEGGTDLVTGHPFSISNGLTPISITTRRALLSIRPKATFGTLTNRCSIEPESFSLGTSSAATQMVYYELVYNPTYTTGAGALTWTSASANSATEYSVHGDANAGTFTGGEVILSGYVPSSITGRIEIFKTILSKLPIALDSAGANPKAIALVCTATGATSCYGSFNWVEYR